MPEEQAPPVEEKPDSPEPSAPDEGQAPESEKDSQPVNYEQSYNELRSKFNARDEEIAQLRQFQEFYGQLTNPETQAEALQRLGLEIEADEPDEDDYQDPDERIDRIEQLLAQQQESAQADELQRLEAQFLDQEIGSLDEKDLTKAEINAVKKLALQMRDDDGLPDVPGAYAELREAADARRERYIASKKAPKVEVGTAGAEKIDMNDEDARRAYMASLIDAEDAAEAA